MAIRKTSYVKNTTNYSKAEISRRARVAAEKVVRQRDIARKSKAATEKINATSSSSKANKRKSTKKTNPLARLNEVGRATKSSAQLRAIYAKKK